MEALLLRRLQRLRGLLQRGEVKIEPRFSYYRCSTYVNMIGLDQDRKCSL